MPDIEFYKSTDELAEAIKDTASQGKMSMRDAIEIYKTSTILSLADSVRGLYEHSTGLDTYKIPSIAESIIMAGDEIAKKMEVINYERA